MKRFGSLYLAHTSMAVIRHDLPFLRWTRGTLFMRIGRRLFWLTIGKES